jgi:hypothetical protein
MADEDEQQEPQEESEITDQREIDARRERLFEGFEEEPEEPEQPQEQPSAPPPSSGIAAPPLTSEEAARGLEVLAPGLGSYMNRFIGDFMASNRREDQMRPPKPPVKIETDWHSFPDVRIRREEPEEEPPVIILGACCNGSTCSMKTRGDCISGGGTFQGEGTSCGTNPCGAITGACCFPDGSCLVKTHSDCDIAMGVYQGDGTNCSDPNKCKGACCHADGTCTPNVAPNSCINAGDTFLGIGSVCTTCPCPQVTAHWTFNFMFSETVGPHTCMVSGSGSGSTVLSRVPGSPPKDECNFGTSSEKYRFDVDVKSDFSYVTTNDCTILGIDPSQSVTFGTFLGTGGLIFFDTTTGWNIQLALKFGTGNPAGCFTGEVMPGFGTLPSLGTVSNSCSTGGTTFNWSVFFTIP